MKIGAVIPCYNVQKYCETIIQQTLSYCDFLIVIDDGSSDNTGSILQRLKDQNQNKIHLIHFSNNQGKGICLLTAFEYALNNTSFDALITLDSDGQHTPPEIPKFAVHLNNGAGVVIGTRDFTQMPFERSLPNRITSFFLKKLFPKAPLDTQSGYRAYQQEFIRLICDHIKGKRYEMELKCILLALHNHIIIVEHPIKTIYLDDNRSSHFRGITDSISILKVLFNYWRTRSI